MMRKTIASIILALAWTALNAQPYTDIKQLYGVYYINDYQEYEVPHVPRGYVPVSISHYGRHGARYQDSEDAYTNVLQPLLDAKAAGELTELGESVCSRTESLYSVCRNHHGELTRLGWNQQEKIARLMYNAFPKVFRKGVEITASSSFSQRCMMSMNAFCVGLKECNPKLDIYAQTSRTLLDQTNPADKQNSNYIPQNDIPSPWNISYKDYLNSIVSTEEAETIMLRLFKDIEYIRKNITSPAGWTQSLYNMVAGIGCTGNDYLIDDVFTESELVKFYKVINYGFFQWGVLSRNKYKPVLKSIVEAGEEDLYSDHTTVRLRFGHDTILEGILNLLQVEGLSDIPQDINNLSDSWNCFMTPMAAHFELVLYKNKKTGNVIVLPLLNDKVVRMKALQTVHEQYYEWREVKEFIDGL